MFHNTSSTTPALPRPPIPRPTPRISLPGSVSTPSLQHHQQQQQDQQQKTIAAAAVETSSSRDGGSGARSSAALQSVQGDSTHKFVGRALQGSLGGPGGGGGINANALLGASIRARYGYEQDERSGDGHGSMGVVMGSRQR